MSHKNFNFRTLFQKQTEENAQPNGVLQMAGDLLIATYDDWIYAFDIHNTTSQGPGAFRWRKNTNGFKVKHIAVSENSVFFTTGKIQRRQDDSTLTSPNISADNSTTTPTLVSVTDDTPLDPNVGNIFQAARGLVVLDLGTGIQRKEWEFVNEHVTIVNPTVSGDTLVFSDDNGLIYGMDIRTQQLLWSKKIGNNAHGHIAINQHAAFFINEKENSLLAVNLKSGKIRWRFTPTGGRSLAGFGQPVLGTETVMIKNDRSNFFALDIKDGKLKYDQSKLEGIGLPGRTNINGPCVFPDLNLALIATQNPQHGLFVLNFNTGHLVTQIDYQTVFNSVGISEPIGNFLAPLLKDDDILSREQLRNKAEHLIFLPTDQGFVFPVLLERDSTFKRRDRYSIQTLPDFHRPDNNTGIVEGKNAVLGGGRIYFPMQTGGIEGISFGTKVVAWFQDDRDAFIELPFEPVYNFGSGDFTIETWVKTTQGGNILSQSPDDTHFGFQFLLGNTTANEGSKTNGEGRMQFAVFGPNDLIQAAQSRPSNVCDGEWHHVAVIRSADGIDFFLDGQRQAHETWHHQTVPFEKPLPVNSTQVLTVGGFQVQSNGEPQELFKGLMDDLRIWNQKLSLSHLLDRMGKQLKGNEHGLLTLLRFGRGRAINVVPGRQTPQTQGLATAVSDLNPIEDLFPYIITHPTSGWPYQERWGVEGAGPVTTPPSASKEILGFGCGTSYYAVDLVHGKRLWEVDAIDPEVPFTLATATDDSRFFILNHNGPQVHVDAIEATSGRILWRRTLDGASRKFAPIVVQGQLVVTTDNRTLHGFDKAKGNPLWSFSLSSGQISSEILFSGKRVYFCAGNQVFSCPIDKTGDLAASDLTSFDMGAFFPQPQLALNKQRLFIYNGRSIEVIDKDTMQVIPNTVWNPELQDIQQELIVGMAASHTLNRLFISTDKGILLGLDFSSGRKVFVQKAGNGRLFKPVISKNHVYCTMTADSTGSLRIFDAKTGILRGEYDPESGPVSAPLIIQDAAYFGCRDHRLHSISFGKEFALQLDGSQNAIEIAGGEKIVLTDPKQFSFEVWYNSQEGGEIISLAPNNKDQTGFRLAITPEGEVLAHVQSTGFNIQAAASSAHVLDGNWHHLAVVVKTLEDGSALKLIYLDGKELPGLTNLSSATAAMTALATDTRPVVIGGNSNTTRFKGFLHDIRLWNESLLPAEINDRMHIKLRGNEPGLLAFWDFSSKSLTDMGPGNISDQKSGDLSFWLFPLNFTRPLYPYLVATTKAGNIVTHPGNNGMQITTGTYTSTIKVNNWNGTPRTNTVVTIWANEDTAIKVSNFSNPNNDPSLTDSGTINASTSIKALTDANGEIDLELTSSNTRFSPELTVHADYMYPNERVHVAAVEESQRHITIQPPQLTAQVRVCTDYHFAQGDDNFDKAETFNHRIILMANTAEGTPLKNQILEVWAEDTLQVYYNSKPYTLTAHNGVRFHTDMQGEVTLLVDASNASLNNPALIVRAEFMPRTARFVVSPSGDAHKRLANIDGDQLNGTKPISSDNPLPKQGLLTGSQTGSADDLSSSIRTVMAAAPASSGPTDQSNITFEDAPYPATANNPDQVHAKMRQAGNNTKEPASVGSMPHANFTIDINRDSNNNITGVTHNTAPTNHAQVLQALSGKPSRPLIGDELGSFWSWLTGTVNDVVNTVGNFVKKDIIDPVEKLAKEGLKDAAALAKAGFDAVKGAIQQIGKIVVTTVQKIVDAAGNVIHHIAVALETLGGEVLNLIIKTVDDVVKAVIAIFKAIEKAIEDVLDFLKALFDWSDIVAIHKVLHKVVDNYFGQVENLLGSELPALIGDTVDGFKQDLNNLGAAWKDKIAGTIPDGYSIAGNPDVKSSIGDQAQSSSNSTQSKWLISKVKENGTGPGVVQFAAFTQQTLTTPQDSLPDPMQDFMNRLEDVIAKLQDLASNPGELKTKGLEDLIDIVIDLADAVLDVLELVLDVILTLVAEFVEGIQAILDTDLDIPFVSAFYKWLTKSDLNILDIICLIGAIPVNILFAFLGKSWSSLGIDENSPEIAGELFKLPNSNGSGDAQGTKGAFEGIFIVARMLNSIFRVLQDIVGGEINAADSEGRVSDTATSILGLIGSIANFISYGSRTVYDNLVHPPSGAFALLLQIFKGLLPLVIVGKSIGNLIPSASSGNVIKNALNGAGKLVLGYDDTVSTFRASPTQIISTIGGFFLLIGHIGFWVINSDTIKDEAIGENICDLINDFILGAQFLDFGPIVDATEGVSPFILAGIDVAGGIADIVVQLEVGNGKESGLGS